MENLTFRSRLLKLIQKSRKAVRLYSSMERSVSDSSSDFREIQTEEWKSITSELLRDLSSAMENPNARRLVSDIYALRDRFYSDWRLAESDLHVGQRDLISAAEHGDFTKSAVLSTKLVRAKARVQACQAAHHEISDVLLKGKVVEPTIELESASVLEMPAMQATLGKGSAGSNYNEGPQQSMSKVIPLRQKRMLGG